MKRDQNITGDGLLIGTTTYDQLYRQALTQEFKSSTDTSGIKIQTRYLYSRNNG